MGVRNKVGGHRVGFFCDDENPKVLRNGFEKGEYQLVLFDTADGFCWFDYVPKK